MLEKIAFLFPGQGSQFVGMGRDLAELYPITKSIFEGVDEICQRPISKLCFEGPMEELTLTENLQPGITAVSLACLSVLQESGVSPVISAGHSLGEYTALVATGIVSSYDALQLVQKRGELMHREAVANPGGMAAVIGMDIEEVEDIVVQAGANGILAVANHNTAEQIAITGDNESLSVAIRLIKEKKGRAVPLKVSGAWHSELMRGAVKDFRESMQDISFFRPNSTLLFNATAEVETDTEKIKDIMARQLVSPVKWYDIILKMLADGENTFVEVGPKKILTGLLKKIVSSDDDVKIHSVEGVDSLESFLKEFERLGTPHCQDKK